jgi:hypothetical protein
MPNRRLKLGYLALATYVVLGAASCHKKTEDPYPEPRVGGPNVMACTINGKPWTAKGTPDSFSGAGIPPVDGGFSSNDTYSNGVLVSYTRYYFLYGGGLDQLELYVYPMKDTGTFHFVNTVPCPRFECLPTNVAYARYQFKYITSATHTGSMHVSYVDTTKNEVMGTFAFQAADTSGNIVNVTDGRFHYKH